MIWIKVHNAQGLKVVAACDEDAMGLPFGSGKISDFYRGKLSEENDLLEMEFDILNLVGEKAVKTALSAGLAKKEAVRTIDGLPHLQVVRI